MLRETVELYSRAAACRACPGMACRPVLSRANGPIPCDILLIGEAPGRFGAGLSGVPFSGDAAGRRLERLLMFAALSRESVFITNAALCLPLDSTGRNRPPTRLEVANCSRWLRETIETVGPRLVVAMGNTALGATRLLQAHSLTLKDSHAAPGAWFGRELAAVYHPGWRAERQRPWDFQTEDWRRLGQWIVETAPSGRTLGA